MRKTITQKVVDKITTSPKARVLGRTMHVLDHNQILRISRCEDSATRRLREKAETFYNVSGGQNAFHLQNEKYVINPSFVSWLKQY